MSQRLMMMRMARMNRLSFTKRFSILSAVCCTLVSSSGNEKCRSSSWVLSSSSSFSTTTRENDINDLTGYYAFLEGFDRTLAEMAFANEVPRYLEDAEKNSISVATFAGGCFWGPQLLFDRVPGVLKTSVGYTQGFESAVPPSYSSVSSGSSGHTEAVLVAFDERVTYGDLLQRFFSHVDPTIANGQGYDRGTQYRTGIYYHTEKQKEEAERAIKEQETIHKGEPIMTEVARAGIFFPAEPEHQDYLARGGRYGRAQSKAKGTTDPIRCYG